MVLNYMTGKVFKSAFEKELSDENIQFLKDNRYFVFPKRDPSEGTDVFTIFQSDRLDHLVIKPVFTFRIPDEYHIRKSVNLNEVITRFRQKKVLNEEFVQNNVFWQQKVTEAIVNIIKNDYNGTTSESLDIMLPDGSCIALGKRKVALEAFESDPILIANSITRNIAPYLSTHPVIYAGDKIPYIQTLDYGDGMCYFNIFATYKKS